MIFAQSGTVKSVTVFNNFSDLLEVERVRRIQRQGRKLSVWKITLTTGAL